jgi:uncharacterized DUF497 family protein
MKAFDWNSEKNQQLIEERGVSFEEVIFFLQHDGLLDDIQHPNDDKYPNQRVFVVNIDGYAYLVPYVETDREIFLKTVIPSRKATRQYLRGGI